MTSSQAQLAAGVDSVAVARSAPDVSGEQQKHRRRQCADAPAGRSNAKQRRRPGRVGSGREY